MQQSLIFSHKKFLIFLFIFSLLVRALFFGCYLRHGERSIIAFDGQQYQLVARNIVQGNGIATAPNKPNFYRLPGYPLFMAACFKIWGESTENMLWVQVVLASFIPALIFCLSLIFFPSLLWLARCAGLWAAVHVGFVLYAGMLASESLFMIFFLLFCGLFFSQLQHNFLWAGIALGFASLIRAVGHYLIILLLLMLLISVFSQREKILATGSLFVGWLSVVGWWLLRNYLLTGFIFFHSLPGLHFLQYPAVNAIMGYANFGDDAYFKTKKQVLAEWETHVQQKEQAEQRSLNEYERYAVAEKLAFSHMLQRPWVSIKNAGVQMAKTCCTMYSSLLLYVPAGTVYEEGTSLWFKVKLYLFPKTHEAWIDWLIYWEVLYYIFMLIGCIAFFTALFWDKVYRIFALKTFPLIGFFIVITFGYGCARLRMPVEPFLMIIALLGWRSLLEAELKVAESQIIPNK